MDNQRYPTLYWPCRYVAMLVRWAPGGKRGPWGDAKRWCFGSNMVEPSSLFHKMSVVIDWCCGRVLKACYNVIKIDEWYMYLGINVRSERICQGMPGNLTILMPVGIFGIWEILPRLSMLWLLKSPEDEHAWYWLSRTDNMYCCSIRIFIYLGQAKSKIRFKREYIFFIFQHVKS